MEHKTNKESYTTKKKITSIVNKKLLIENKLSDID